MRLTTVWTGTQTELEDILQAVRHNCTCQSTSPSQVQACPAHAMLLADQPGINRLLFMRRMAARLLIEEWTPSETEGGRG
jgi:hypothetical protein